MKQIQLYNQLRLFITEIEASKRVVFLDGALLKRKTVQTHAYERPNKAIIIEASQFEAKLVNILATVNAENGLEALIIMKK